MDIHAYIPSLTSRWLHNLGFILGGGLIHTHGYIFSICFYIYTCGNVSFVLVSPPGLSKAAEPFRKPRLVFMLAAGGRPGRTQAALEGSRPDPVAMQAVV